MFCITAEPNLIKKGIFYVEAERPSFSLCISCLIVFTARTVVGEHLQKNQQIPCKLQVNFTICYWPKESQVFCVVYDQLHLAIANWLWHTHFSIVTDGYRCVTRHALGRHERGFSIWFQSTFSRHLRLAEECNFFCSNKWLPTGLLACVTMFLLCFFFIFILGMDCKIKGWYQRLQKQYGHLWYWYICLFVISLLW